MYRFAAKTTLAVVLTLFAFAPRAATASHDGPDPGPPSESGQWTTATVFRSRPSRSTRFVLRTGKVLFWSFPPLDDSGVRPNAGRAALWDPAMGTGPEAMKDVTPPVIDLNGDEIADAPAPIFCSGQSLLADGRVLVVGGNLDYGTDEVDSKGLNTAFVFDPAQRPGLASRHRARSLDPTRVHARRVARSARGLARPAATRSIRS